MTREVEFAEQQLIGYAHAKKGYSLNDLISSMNLSKKEWMLMKDKLDMNYLSEKDKKEIDCIFNL